MCGKIRNTVIKNVVFKSDGDDESCIQRDSDKEDCDKKKVTDGEGC